MPRKYLFALAAGAFAATTLPAATPARRATAQYDVQVRMQDGDQPATNPRLLTNAGAPATFVIANDSYSLSMTVTTDTDGHVSLASQFSSWTPHGLANDAQALRLEADGEGGMLSFARTDPATGAERHIRLDVRVRRAG
jgi:hypothetical protein